ncbi:hypothetical protein WH50_18155 [Pokkaliibacter plantistimulans]|uniref:Uncharacterized protein n=1 Tax=Pokkaliibacter plantistimulans TaxID=1635171 RepID=A0ABX5LU73_9GAMM|nr:hypothetical protein WH50_18155 [Pokkaliibacter plantistimulans]
MQCYSIDSENDGRRRKFADAECKKPSQLKPGFDHKLTGLLALEVNHLLRLFMLTDYQRFYFYCF